ncbi:MAG: deoxyribose-phosphate aldolase [Deltaproteobacteria bacterium]|nr:deoxyribose-phosphate aldolase [Deltaproteobacteria bacterium]
MIQQNFDSKKIHSLFINTVDSLKNISPVKKLPVIDGKINRRIEHTLLKIDSSLKDVDDMCRTALDNSFRSVCCMQRDTAYCKTILNNSKILTVQVIDFPLGMNAPGLTAKEAENAVQNGADEVDMLLDLRAIKAGDIQTACTRINEVVAAIFPVPVKVILETALLSHDEIVKACAAAYGGGASFVKTSTGFSKRGASIEDISIMKSAIADRMLIKASGGIKNNQFTEQLISAGADVLGTSNGIACIKPE